MGETSGNRKTGDGKSRADLEHKMSPNSILTGSEDCDSGGKGIENMNEMMNLKKIDRVIQMKPLNIWL